MSKVPSDSGKFREDTVLTPRQETVALALATGSSDREAAKEAGITDRVIRKWKTETPEFNRRVSELRARMTDEALGTLVAGMRSASNTLLYLSRKGRQETVRLGAARSLIELGTKMTESAHVQQQIDELKAELKALREGWHAKANTGAA
jgi:hypothetical protein